MNVVAMRMISGEEVMFRTVKTVAELNELLINSFLFEVEKPVTMVPVENKVTFMPWIFFSSADNFSLCSRNVITFYQPQNQLEGEYLKMTSGIIMPSLA